MNASEIQSAGKHVINRERIYSKNVEAVRHSKHLTRSTAVAVAEAPVFSSFMLINLSELVGLHTSPNIFKIIGFESCLACA